MADERPDKDSGTGGSGPGEQGHGRRGGRRRGFRGKHGGQRDATGREGQGAKPRDASTGAGTGDDRQRQGGRQPAGGRAQGGRDSQSRDQRPPRPEAPRMQPEEPKLRPEDMPSCPLCGKPVYDLSTAMSASREAGEPAHFDCVLERVMASEALAAGEKIVYLGSGAFGVVEFLDKSESHFSVKRRVQWEKEGEKKDWRKGLSSRISNL